MSKSQSPMRVFVVENHPDTVKYLCIHLEQLGYVVDSAISVEEALKKAPSFDCDVFISDIGLPDGDGWTLLKNIRFTKPVYAIAMSGFGMGQDRIKSMEAGYRHHILKPFMPEELDSMLEKASLERSAIGNDHAQK